jgi:hypothetical protein
MFDGVYGAEGKTLHLIGIGFGSGRGSRAQRAHAQGGRERASERASDYRRIADSPNKLEGGFCFFPLCLPSVTLYETNLFPCALKPGHPDDIGSPHAMHAPHGTDAKE